MNRFLCSCVVYSNSRFLTCESSNGSLIPEDWNRKLKLPCPADRRQRHIGRYSTHRCGSISIVYAIAHEITNKRRRVQRVIRHFSWRLRLKNGRQDFFLFPPAKPLNGTLIKVAYPTNVVLSLSTRGNSTVVPPVQLQYHANQYHIPHHNPTDRDIFTHRSRPRQGGAKTSPSTKRGHATLTP